MRVGDKIRRIFGQTAGTPGHETITLSVRDRKVRVHLDPSLPDDAYQQLFTLDLSSVSTGDLSWDHRRRSWCSA